MQFTNDNIDKISASGSLAYCEATQIVKEDPKLLGKGDVNTDIKTQVYVWGYMPFGVNMKLNSVINPVPQVFREVDRYNFGKIHLNNDFALGVGHCLRITFELPDANKEYGKADQDG